jgi:sulfate permease, SulP family
MPGGSNASDASDASNTTDVPAAGLAARLLPGVARLRRYERRLLRIDVVAGITVAAYLVPQVMGYAEVAGLAPVVGLWAIMASLVVYSAIGSSPQLSVGPESTTALMTATALAPLALGDPARYAAMAAALAAIVGGLCLVGWVARLGFLADLLSHPVLIGYMAGVAVIMIVGQLGKLTGVDVEGDTIIAEMRSFLTGIDDIQWPTFILGLCVLVLLLVAGRAFPRAPVPLLGMLLATAAASLLSLEDHGVALIGDIPASLPSFQLPDVSIDDLTALVLPAIGVAVVGYTDNVLTARAFATRNRYAVDANQELLALGAANLATSVVQGFPVSSSGSRTVIADSMGSRSQMYSLVAAAAVLATLLFLRPLLAVFPTAALAAVVVYAAIQLVDVAEFRRIARFRHSELLLAGSTTVAVLVLGVLYGVLFAIALSITELVRRVARPHDGILGFVPGVAGMHDIDDYADAKMVPGLVVYRYDSPLFFANAADFKRRALESVDQATTPVEWFLLNAEANVEVDITSMDALEQLRAELEHREIVFAMARVKEDLRDDLEAHGFVQRLGEDRVFMTLPTAVEAYAAWYRDRHGVPPQGVVIPEPPPSPLDPDVP